MSMINGFINSTITCNERKEVDLDALNFLAAQQNGSFCSCTYKNENRHHLFVYDTTDAVSLTHLKAGLTFENAIDVFASALKMLQIVSENNLVLDNVKCSKEYILKIDDDYKFVYLPLVHKAHITPRDFMLKLLAVVHHKDIRLIRLVKELRRVKDDNLFISRLTSFVTSYEVSIVDNSEDDTSLLSSDSGFDAARIQQLNQQDISFAESTDGSFAEGETTILSQNPDNTSTSDNTEEAIPQEPKSYDEQHLQYSGSSALEEGETTFLNQNIDEIMLNAEQYSQEPIIYDAVQVLEDGETTVLSQENYQFHSGSLSNDDSQHLTQRFVDESDEQETTFLSEQDAVVVQAEIHEIDSDYALYLIRNINGERIDIDITPFSIGKDSTNMDFVLNNASVSRYHATIIHEDGRYYIVDNNSTNGTTIEGIKLQPNEKGEIGNGYIISLGNESFQAHIERR